MKVLSSAESKEFLSQVGMRVNEWNQIAIVDPLVAAALHRTSFHIPAGALELLSLAHYASGWLPRGKWKILQIDNSNYFNAVDRSLLNQLLFGPDSNCNLNSPERSSFLFEFSDSRELDQRTELLVSHVVHALLLIEGHGYLVSSGSQNKELLGIQDGVLYFSSSDPELCGARDMLRQFQTNPRSNPAWIVEVIAEDQARAVGGYAL